VWVLRTAGINCDEETVFAWQQAGADAQRIHVDRLIEAPGLLGDAHVMTVPGGFSYGDDIAAGTILAQQLVNHLADPIRAFIDAGGLMLGICNGFQVLLKARFLPDLDAGPPQVTLTMNDSARFEARWVTVQVETDRCCFLRPGMRLRLPVAHAEGKIAVAGPQVVDALRDGGRIALRYGDADGRPGGYPVNPNGSIDHIAGLTDATGQILGLMPHPERHVDPMHDPLYTRTGRAHEPDGLTVFRAAVDRFR
jgi:phosphoribosylformylglycinamidine synthase